jgi:hypothetical protein
MTRFLALFVTAVTIALPAVASAKVVTVCGGNLPALSQNVTPRPFAALAYAAPGTLIRSPRTALTKDEAGYDIHLNWGDADETSLRGFGAEILDAGFDDTIVHLMVARTGSDDVQHFLFSLDNGGSGEMLFGTGDEESDQELSRKSCTAP